MDRDLDKDNKPAAAGAGRRWARRAGVAVLGLALLWALGWFALPPLLKSQAEQRLGALLGREVRIGDVAFAPWSLQLTVRDLRVAAAEGGDRPPQFSFGRLFVNASASSLFRRAPVLEAIELDDPVLRVARLPDGRLDIDDIAARLKPAPDAPASDEPARFALYNLQLRGGAVEIDDRVVGQQHALKQLHVALPFLSNLPADIAVKVEPRIAFALDGSAFDSGAQVVPFAEQRSGRVQLRIDALDLARYAAYLPSTLPLRLRRGTLSSDLEAEFTLDAAGHPTLALRGRAGLRDLALSPASSEDPLVAWRQLQVGLDDVRPLARQVALGEVVLDGLQLRVRREADGRLELQRLLAGSGGAAKPAAPPASAASPAAAAPAPGNWAVSVQRVKLTDGGVAWQDAAVRPSAALRVEALAVDAGPYRSAEDAPSPLRWSARLAADGTDAATLVGEGRAGPAAVDLGFQLDGLSLSALAPYLAEVLQARVDGRVGLQGRYEQAAGDAPKQALTVARLRVDALRLREDAAKPAAAAAWQSLEATDARVDLLGRRVVLGRVSLQQPQFEFARAADGQLNVERWLRSSAPAADGAARAAAAPTEAPWKLQLGELKVDGGRVGWRDARAGDGHVAVQVDALALGLQSLQWPVAAKAPPAKLTLSARLADLRPGRTGATPGRVDWRGEVVPTPLLARGELRAERLPLHAFAPYIPTGLQIELARAEAGWRGRVAVQQAPAGLDVTADGDALLGNVRVLGRGAGGADGEELLNWQRFALTGLKLRLPPGGAPAVEVREAALSDFYSRLVITEQGRFNLRDVTAAPADAASAPAPAPAAAPASAPAPAAAGASAPAFSLAVESTRLTNGRVDFTDRFVKPNYSAALSELEGTLGAFRTGTPALAPLALHGRVAGTGVLEVAGAINPLAHPLALDVRAKASEIELSPLSPYAARYAGYGIERGKLSTEVAYKIDPDGKLSANNRIVLNQLTFGDKVDSPDATKLPVALAIALLKDRNGVIDLDLPVSGSLNDPQFSVFGIALKLIGNLIVKAVTAPFSLLFGGGGSDDGGLVTFVSGTDRLTPAGTAAIDKMAKALADRPSLQLTITGTGDPAAERDGVRGALLDARLQAARARAAGGADEAASAPPPPAGAERDALLARVYADTKLPDKPRNFIGLAKSLPPAEMEARLKAAIPVDDERMRDLAQRRGFAVRDALIAKGLPSERLFVAAPRLGAPVGAASAPSAASAPPLPSTTAGGVAGVQLSVATR